MSTGTSRRRSTRSTVSDCSDLSHQSYGGVPGILKRQNSGPTCDMPVRFQLPNTSRVVYPAKAYHDEDSMETEDDDDESMSLSSDRHDY